jgi:hypothetical protein
MIVMIVLGVCFQAHAHEPEDVLAPFFGLGTSVASIPFETEVGATEVTTGTWSLMGGVAFSAGVDHTLGRLGGHVEFGPRATFLPQEDMGMGFAVAGCADVMWRPAHHILLGPSACVEVYEPFAQRPDLSSSFNFLAGVSFLVPFMIGDAIEAAPRLFISLAPGLHEGRVLLVPSISLGFDMDALLAPAPTL